MAKYLKDEFLEKGAASEDLKFQIAKANSGLNGSTAKMSTVARWFKTNDIILTTATNLDIMAEWFGTNPNDLVEEKELATA